jgi:hypothetical protein
MAKRRKRVKQRPAIGALGKELTRRAHARCELCESRDELRGFELAPFPLEPEMDRALLTCGRCREWLEHGGVVPIEAHFLRTAVWSAHDAVRLAAARLLLSIDDPEDPWMREVLEASGVDPETQELRTA